MVVEADKSDAGDGRYPLRRTAIIARRTKDAQNSRRDRAALICFALVVFVAVPATMFFVGRRYLAETSWGLPLFVIGGLLTMVGSGGIVAALWDRYLLRQAEKLWDAPKASRAAGFTMRIGSVFDSGGGVMVAGTPKGIPPSVGDKVQVVGANGTMEATIKDTTRMGGRVAYVLSGIAEGRVKQGDVLQH